MLDGYNICVFAYGQTGSGKTHSMQGNPQEPGIYRRTFRNYFEVIKERGSDWKYKLSVALLEVYNDEVYDLLDTASVRRKLQLRQSKEGGVQIPDLTCRPVASDEDISNVLATGESNRSVASTNMNEHSSRSHLIVQVHAEITMPNGKEVNSKMNLIDLAGSERLKTSGAEGARAKETMHINKSLSSLGDVIAARASKASHVPYRESKLTHLLQDSLGGESKTLMLLQISPVEDSCDETTNSLNFGSRVNAVEMDKPTKKGAAK
jgi:kinesin family protein C2/C3